MKQAKRKKLKKTHAPTLWIGLFMMGLLVVLAVLAPVICPYDPLEQNLAEFLQAPGAKHLFGTDQLGRDLFTRTLYAARTDLWIMVMAEIAPFIIGISLAIVIALASGAGSHGIFITYLLVGWLIYCKVARGQSAALKNSEWNAAAKILGYSDIRILFCELLPNIIPQAIVLLMTDMVGLLVIIVTLGYLGIGISPPTPDWGTMISEGQTFMTSAWWLSVLPGMFVVYTGVALSFIGDGLADRFR